MLDKRLDSGETSSNGETDLDSDKTEPDSNKTAESTSSQRYKILSSLDFPCCSLLDAIL